MLFILGVVLTTEHIHKFSMDGPGLEVPNPGVFTLHGGSVEWVISDFRHTRVCDFELCANLFLSNLQELRYALNSILCMSYVRLEDSLIFKNSSYTPTWRRHLELVNSAPLAALHVCA
jgi:hypothetical protein